MFIKINNRRLKMTTQQQMEKLYKKYRTKYFKKYFLDKNIHEAMYESSKMVILNLVIIQTKISMLTDCLSTLRRDKEFFSTLNNETQRIMKSYIIGYKSLNREVEKILKPILAGLKGEM